MVQFPSIEPLPTFIAGEIPHYIFVTVINSHSSHDGTVLAYSRVSWHDLLLCLDTISSDVISSLHIILQYPRMCWCSRYLTLTSYFGSSLLPTQVEYTCTSVVVGKVFVCCESVNGSQSEILFGLRPKFRLFFSCVVILLNDCCCWQSPMRSCSERVHLELKTSSRDSDGWWPKYFSI